jgi:MFS family permease
VLHENPANSVYIFAPASIGLLVGTLIAPRLIAKVGERRVATSSVVLMCGGMVLLGLIDVVAPVLAPISPLRVVELLGVSLNDRVLAASVISIPLNFGSTSCGASVTNFINRLVPVVNQGATFGLQEVQKNLLSLVAVITLGGIADIVGAQPVMVIAPVFVVGLVLWLLRYSYRYVLHTRLSPREAWELLRTEPSES